MDLVLLYNSILTNVGELRASQSLGAQSDPGARHPDLVHRLELRYKLGITEPVSGLEGVAGSAPRAGPPAPGRITLFDRSHYEQVLVVRVHGLQPWQDAYDEINTWESRLVAQGVTILKVMLHISKDEQGERLLKRLADPTKHWKYNPADVDEHQQWGDYQAAYEDMLRRCSTDVAPWFVVPANRKWHRDWLLSALLAETLEAIRVAWPKATFDPAVEARAVLRELRSALGGLTRAASRPVESSDGCDETERDRRQGFFCGPGQSSTPEDPAHVNWTVACRGRRTPLGRRGVARESDLERRVTRCA